MNLEGDPARVLGLLGKQIEPGNWLGVQVLLLPPT